MKLSLLCYVLLLTGCNPAVNVHRNFPDIPPSLQEPCAKLTLVANNTSKLSDVLRVVTDNYSQYHECSIKVQTWKEWYDTQKKIFEEVK